MILMVVKNSVAMEYITLGDNNHVHSLQKGLKGAFTAAEFAELMEELGKGVKNLEIWFMH